MSARKYPTTTPDWRAAARTRRGIYTLAALLLSTLFAILVYQLYAREANVIWGSTLPAVFARHELERGEALKENSLEIKRVPPELLPDSYFDSIKPLIGSSLAYPVAEGEILVPAKLQGMTKGSLAYLCPAGKWCLNIPQDWFIAPPPELAVGDWVDIVAAYPGNSMEESGFIAGEVEVILLPEENGPVAYILALDDQEALAILYAHANDFQVMVLLRPAGRE